MKEIEEKKPSKILPILISVVGVIAIAAGLFLEVQDTNDKLVNGENNGKVSTVNYLVNDSTYADIVVEAKEEKTEKVTLKNPDKESNYQLYYTSDILKQRKIAQVEKSKKMEQKKLLYTLKMMVRVKLQSILEHGVQREVSMK